VRLKIWTSLISATVAVAANAHAEPASPYPGGTLDHAIEKMFDGEGGEGGIGMSRLTDQVSFPALREDQIKVVASGNTIRSGNRFAVYLRPDGKVEGWSKRWTRVAADACKPNLKPGHTIDEDGACLSGREEAVSGVWAVRDGRLCLPSVFEDPTDTAMEPERCYGLALVVNNVLPFDKDGKLVRRPMDLAKGDSREKITR
jgi:hypothetical protein